MIEVSIKILNSSKPQEKPRVKNQGQDGTVSGSAWKELGSYCSILTASENLNGLNNQQVFICERGADMAQPSASDCGGRETDGSGGHGLPAGTRTETSTREGNPQP